MQYNYFIFHTLTAGKPKPRSSTIPEGWRAGNSLPSIHVGPRAPRGIPLMSWCLNSHLKEVFLPLPALEATSEHGSPITSSHLSLTAHSWEVSPQLSSLTSLSSPDSPFYTSLFPPCSVQLWIPSLHIPGDLPSLDIHPRSSLSVSILSLLCGIPYSAVPQSPSLLTEKILFLNKPISKNLQNTRISRKSCHSSFSPLDFQMLNPCFIHFPNLPGEVLTRVTGLDFSKSSLKMDGYSLLMGFPFLFPTIQCCHILNSDGNSVSPLSSFTSDPQQPHRALLAL